VKLFNRPSLFPYITVNAVQPRRRSLEVLRLFFSLVSSELTIVSSSGKWTALMTILGSRKRKIYPMGGQFVDPTCIYTYGRAERLHASVPFARPVVSFGKNCDHCRINQTSRGDDNFLNMSFARDLRNLGPL